MTDESSRRNELGLKMRFLKPPTPEQRRIIRLADRKHRALATACREALRMVRDV